MSPKLYILYGKDRLFALKVSSVAAKSLFSKLKMTALEQEKKEITVSEQKCTVSPNERSLYHFFLINPPRLFYFCSTEKVYLLLQKHCLFVPKQKFHKFRPLAQHNICNKHFHLDFIRKFEFNNKIIAWLKSSFHRSGHVEFVE